ncbi:restriction endonuclease [Corynebacterium sp. AOP40-9SA-29]|uniref:restriction endonuclease n=1 Tax=Corynebacterium sp. AOP40-9SA-29 TaxID=3457677 RepID=UPI00403361D7
MSEQIWGIHNDTVTDQLVDEGFVSIGWDEVGDLSKFSSGRDSIKKTLAEKHPNAKTNSIAGQAGVLYRFAREVSVGDIIVAPYRPDSTINIGKVDSEYYFEEDAPTHRHRHRVRWIKTGLPRAVFSQSALYELGSALTLFKVSRHTDEVFAVLHAKTNDADAIADTVDALTKTRNLDEEADAPESDEPRASRIERHTRDFILEVLTSAINPREFEELSADLLRAIGYQARVTQYSQDGGIDVVAHKDPLGIEPPLIKAQCKQRVSTIGSPEVNQLIGTQGDGELCLFFTLGSYSRDAIAIERQRSGIRLLSGEDIVSLIIDNYAQLPERWRRAIPLTSVLVVSDEAE